MIKQMCLREPKNLPPTPTTHSVIPQFPKQREPRIICEKKTGYKFIITTSLCLVYALESIQYITAVVHIYHLQRNEQKMYFQGACLRFSLGSPVKTQRPKHYMVEAEPAVLCVCLSICKWKLFCPLPSREVGGPEGTLLPYRAEIT